MNYPELERLIGVVEKLRNPDGGCPWDLKQTHQSLLKYLVEESYEFIDACERRDSKDMEEELGDVLLQVLLHATIAKQEERFSLESVAKRHADKLIYRHPHVFEDVDKGISSDQVITNWEKLKKAEKKSESEIPLSLLKLPSLVSAEKIGKKTSKINFDWPNATEVLKKVREELDEFQKELDKKEQDRAKMQEELGDLLFSTAQLARHLKFDAEETLRKANNKFVQRFHKMERLMKEDGTSFEGNTQKKLDLYWDRVKNEE